MLRFHHSRRSFIRDSTCLALAASTGSMANAFQEQLPGMPAQADGIARATVAQGKRGVVATVHPLASQAAIAAFERGGNAIDAAVAASLMLSVVDGHNSGIGGGCLALIRNSTGQVIAIDGREKAPQSGTPEMFFRNGKPDPDLSREGPLAAGVPGLLAALDALRKEFGRLPWQDALNQAALVAEKGFVLTDDYAGRLDSVASSLAHYPSSAKILLNKAGQPWKTGDVLRQTDLAKTLRFISEQGVDWFYRGPFAQMTEKMMQDSGGQLRVTDFEKYNVVLREPVSSTYRGKTVLGCPPPSSGGIHVAQMLGMLVGFDVHQIFQNNRVQGLHLLLEVMKRAMADRAHWLGDADFTAVPKSLLDADYLRMRASSIDLMHATKVESFGIPPRADRDLFGAGGHTTHLTTADSEGNLVALTQTINTTFGCKMIVPGTGVVLNNEMDDFSIAPGVRNAFGLVGSKANVIEPEKRPLSSMSPTIVLNEEGQPVLSCGAAGGPKIITSVLQVLVGVLDLGLTIDQAIAAPRVHHQWSPDSATCETALGSRSIAQLQELGHETHRISSAAVAQGVAVAEGRLTAASDPRVASACLAW
ncbi:MAG: gamma-glutamyltransferase [Planctomycetales bacterium]|nr:gamma-glutamyltransferase [Planctomycetales bacterium]